MLPHGASSTEKAPIDLMGSHVQAQMAINPRSSEWGILVCSNKTWLSDNLT